MLTYRQILSLRKALANHTSVDTKLAKTKLAKMQKGDFLKILMPFQKWLLPLLKYLIKLLGNAGFNWGCINNRCGNKQKILGSGNQITLIIFNVIYKIF